MRPVDRLREFVIARRGQLGISQALLAERSGVSKGMISMLESGGLESPPKTPNLRKLAKGLGVPVEDVLVAAGLLDNLQRELTRHYRLHGKELLEHAEREGVPLDEQTRKAIEEAIGFTTLEGGLGIPEDVPEPPDEWELSVLEKTGALRSHDYSKESDFWYLPREDRRALLRNLEDVWFEDQRLRKKMAEQRSGKHA